MSFLVIGAGSWGSALAVHLARLHSDSNVYLTGRDDAQLNDMQLSRENKKYLSGVALPSNINALNFSDVAHILKNPEKNLIENIIIAVPSHVFKEVLVSFKPYLDIEKQIIVGITKGLEPSSHCFLHEVAKSVLGETVNYSVLSGPSFAKEVALELPTAVTLSGRERSLVSLFHSPRFRVYFSEDIIGVQLGGAVKNVLAIAVGIADGLQYGANAQAALITRGLSEMMRLGKACGAQVKTLMGLSGVGDLVLTATNNQSRNRRFGILLGQGFTREAAEKSIGQVVEGINTTKEIYALSQKYQLDMPITTQIYQLLRGDITIEQALQYLLMREPKVEDF